MSNENTDSELIFCYNRGCGKKFNPKCNKNDDCVHHPGEPVFHDAYKIWPCCNKKCIDFSEFLNVKGCTISSHTNIMTPTSVKNVTEKSTAEEVIQVCRQPLVKESEERPSFDAPQIILSPSISPSIHEQVKGLMSFESAAKEEGKVSIGQCCTNKSCKAIYNGSESNAEICCFHPGIPIFHEGMKYWSCCQKKTTDFAVFLEQPGCTQGNHLWISKDSGKTNVQCRMDWHQTGSNVVISIYAKKYLPSSSTIKLSPVRLTVDLYFPEGNSRYNLDIELSKVIIVEKSKASMNLSKIEIMLAKRDSEYWHKLDNSTTASEMNEVKQKNEEPISAEINALDLSDL